MKPLLVALGIATIYMDKNSGRTCFDEDSLRRVDSDGNVAGTFGDIEFGYDDFGEDDFGEDDFGEDDFGEDDFGEDDFGAEGRRRSRGSRKTGSARSAKDNWVTTTIGGSATLGAAGNASIQIRLQHDFKAQDITFDGSLAGSKITSIYFGDKMIWQQATGAPITIFATGSFLRGLLKGNRIKAGLDITINGTLTGAGDLVATLVGQKPRNNGC